MILNLISGPRNVSTALMYSFANRPDFMVVDEPFYGCYLSETGANHPAKEQVMQEQSIDPTAVIHQLTEGSFTTPHVFIKNMAHHLERVPHDFLRQMDNLFLIRDPHDMILSFIKKIPDPTLQDTAYRQQFRLFNFLFEKTGCYPMVLDAAELLKNPENILQAVCKTAGISFDSRMLHWEAGPIPEDGVWAEHWYENVHRSTGFEPYRPKNENVPDRLQPLLQTCNKYYKKLAMHAIKAK